MRRQAYETWKSIVGWEGYYEVSDLGRIKSVAKSRGRQLGRIMIHGINSDGYHRVRLNRHAKQTSIGVHFLVAAAFLGPCPDGMEVNHINGDKGDNHPQNLEYLTHQQNTQHAITILGRRIASAEEHGRAKLTWDDINQIRLARQNGASIVSLATQSNVSKSTIRRIVRFENWKPSQGG